MCIQKEISFLTTFQASNAFDDDARTSKIVSFVATTQLSFVNHSRGQMITMGSEEEVELDVEFDGE